MRKKFHQIQFRRRCGPCRAELTKTEKSESSSLTMSSSPLSLTVEEQFLLPLYVTSIPETTSTASMFSPLSLSTTPLFSPYIPPPFVRHHQPPPISAVVELPGFINLRLRHDMVLSISSNLAIRLKNLQKQSSFSLSSCSTQMATVHPKGRMLQYGPRVEVQVEDNISVKNAKIFPRGISFTANNMALVYLLDEAGNNQHQAAGHGQVLEDQGECRLLDYRSNFHPAERGWLGNHRERYWTG